MQVSLGGTVVKNPPAISGNARDAGSILGLEDPQRRKMYPTPVFLPDRGAWRATVQGVSETNTHILRGSHTQRDTHTMKDTHKHILTHIERDTDTLRETQTH